MNIMTIVGIFIWVFIAVVLFAVFNTIIGGEVVPTFNDIANNSDFVDYTEYQERESMIVNVFYIVLGIMVIAPFAYLLVRGFLKREPDPYGRGFN